MLNAAASPDGETPVPPRAGRREWIGLAVLALPCLLYSMDLTVLNMAIPQLAADLHPSAAQLLWIVDIYGFLVAGSLITMGTLGDRIGRRKLLMIGAAAFGCASIFAAFATTANMLILARALLGLAAATLAPSTLSLIRNMFLDPSQRALAIGIWIASFSAGGSLGPLIGGVLLQFFWWGSVFLLAVPMMLLILGLGPHLLPEFRDPHPGRIDLPSVGLSIIAVLAVIWGMKHVAVGGGLLAALAAIAAGLALALIFLRRQRHLEQPLIDLSILTNPAIGAALTTNIICLFIAFGSFLFIAQYLQLVLGMSPLHAGLWSAPTGVAFAVGSVATPLLARRIAPSRLMAGGFVLAAFGLMLMAQLGAPGWGFPALIAGMILFCLGLSPVGALTTDYVVGLAPPERAGAAAAISETSFEFGGAVGIAVLGSIITAIYQAGIAAALPPGTPEVTAAAARQTIAGAATAAHELGPAGEPLLQVARTVFIHALETTFTLSAVISLVAAFLVIAVLGRVAAPAPSQH